MYFVHFFASKNPLLCQLLRQVPSLGEEITIKGRKGIVTSIEYVDDQTVHVLLELQTVKKGKVTPDLSKQKKR